MSLRWIQGGFNAKSIQDTARAEVSVKVTPGSSFSHYITDITISGGATAVTWQVRDGSADLFKGTVAINTVQNIHFRVPLKVGKDKAITVTSGASVGSGILIHGFTDRG